MQDGYVRKLVSAALFAALVCVAELMERYKKLTATVTQIEPQLERGIHG